MGLLKSANTPGIDLYEYRDNLYWGKYRYRARVTFEGARFLYWATSVEDWKQRLQKSGPRGKKAYTPDEIKDLVSKASIVDNLIKLRKERKKTKNRSLRIEGNTAAVFSDDLAFLHNIKSWHPDIQVDFTEVQTVELSGTKLFVRQPKHKFRVYLKSKRVDQNVAVELRELFQRNKSLKPSNALKIWVAQDSRNTWRNRYCSAAYSIDYDEESTLSYLLLCHGDLIGKKYKLEKRPEAT